MATTVTVKFNEITYVAIFNADTKEYEVEVTAPKKGGIYKTEIYADDGTTKDSSSIDIRVLAEVPIKIKTEEAYMYIFDYKDFSVKDVVVLTNYEINIDEETNANSIMNVLKKTTAKTNDIVMIKENNDVIYWGVIENIQNEDGTALYQYTTKYITNMFNQDVILSNENVIKTNGIEDFIQQTINNNFVTSSDTFLNRKYIKLIVKSHTKLNASASTIVDVQNNIYNLHTFITNCTQLYNITFEFNIVNKNLEITIENKQYKKQLIDVNAQPIAQYTEVFETDVIAKVVVLTANEGTYTLYLKTDRTTTENASDTNRAEGKTAVVYSETMADARQKALDTVKGNAYNHNVSFDYYDRLIKIGTPITIKTKESLIYDSYISAIKLTFKNKFINYSCGNIRINFIDKLLKERKK